MRVTGIERVCGKSIPWYMGFAYPLISEDVLIFYPLGINVLVRWTRSIYLWFRYQSFNRWEKDLMEARKAAGPDWRNFNDKVELEINRRFNEASRVTGIKWW